MNSGDFKKSVATATETLSALKTAPALAFVAPASDKCDPEVITMIRAITDAFITGESENFKSLRLGAIHIFTERMRSIANRDKNYDDYLVGMKALIDASVSGKSVAVETDLLTYDFKQIFEVYRKVGGVIGKRIENLVGTVAGYRVSDFHSGFRKQVVYALIKEGCPGLLEVILKNKITLYVTEDFNLAVCPSFAKRDAVVTALEPYKVVSQYVLSPHLTMHVAQVE